MPFPILALAGPIIEIVGKIFDKVIPDKDAAAKAKAELAILVASQNFQAAMRQADANVESAKHPSIFVAGARPFILWICGLGFGWAVLVEPLLKFVAVVSYGYTGTFPAINEVLIMQALFGLLGLSGMRSYDAKQGTKRQNMAKPQPVEFEFPEQE